MRRSRASMPTHLLALAVLLFIVALSSAAGMFYMALYESGILLIAAAVSFLILVGAGMELANRPMHRVALPAIIVAGLISIWWFFTSPTKDPAILMPLFGWIVAGILWTALYLVRTRGTSPSHPETAL